METINYKGFTIKIENDENSINPREDWDNLGTMVCFHNRYELGDKNTGYDSSDFNSFDELKEKLFDDGAVLVLPIYMYDHSGITINTTPFNCNWDSGQIGFIFVKKEDIEKEGGFPEDWKNEYHKGKSDIEIAQTILEGEIETYDQYLKGEVYGYDIEGINDSCWGFFGYDHEKSGLLDEAKGSIDCEIQRRVKKRIEKVKGYIKNKVPMIYRVLPTII